MTTKELNQKAFSYILNAIDSEGYDIVLTDDKSKLQFVADNFKSEYDYMINRIGYVNAMREWFMGLPSCINIDFENYRIIEIAKEWGSIPNNATDRQEDKILDNWFNLIANKTCQLMKKYKVLPQ